MTKVPKKARFNVIIEAGAYKFIPANKTAEKFCKSYGTEKLWPSEAIAIGIHHTAINWKAVA